MQQQSWRTGTLAFGVMAGACEVEARNDAASTFDETTLASDGSDESIGSADEMAFEPVDGDRLAGVDDPSPVGTGGNTGGDTPPPDVDPLPWDSDELVGIGIAGSTGYVYAWNHAHTVSAGIPAQLTSYRSPYPWSAPAGVHVREFSISTTDKTYVWFDDGTVGKGSTSSPTSLSLLAYSLPGGRTPDDIVGMAIRKTDDQTHAYYDDGTYSRGSTTAPGSVASGAAYSLPPGRTTSAIVGMDFGSDNKLYTWFDDGYYSIGTASDLDAYQAPRRYARHGLLASHWPANVNTPPGPPSDWPPAPGDSPSGGPILSPSPSPIFDVAGGNSYDMVLAAGTDAIGLALDASVYFYDKSGTPLSGTGFGSNGRLQIEQMFAEFVRTSAVAAGSEAPNDVNQYMGFQVNGAEIACDAGSLPSTNGYKYCVDSAPYDTRVAYDVEGDRWVIAGAVRNVLATTYYSNLYLHPDATEAEVLAMPYKNHSNCGAYPSPTGTVLDVPSSQHCKLTRHLVVLAVSRTSDPRDGFFTYAFVESNYRDWPWLVIDGDWLILSHAGDEQPLGPVASLVSLEDMRMGRVRPEYIHYYESDLGGHVIAEPPAQAGTWPDHSLVVDRDGADWTMFALPHPDEPYAKQPAASTEITLSDASDFPPEKGVFRHDALHLVSEVFNAGKTESEVHWVRVPLSLAAGEPVATTDWPDYKHFIVAPGDASEQRYDEPVVAINGAHEGLLVYGTSGVDPDDEIAPGASHRIWRHYSPWLDIFQTFKAGTSYADGYPRERTKAITAAVDPVDDRAFWAVQKYGTASGWRAVVGKVQPKD